MLSLPLCCSPHLDIALLSPACCIHCDILYPHASICMKIFFFPFTNGDRCRCIVPHLLFLQLIIYLGHPPQISTSKPASFCLLAAEHWKICFKRKRRRRLFWNVLPGSPRPELMRWETTLPIPLVSTSRKPAWSLASPTRAVTNRLCPGQSERISGSCSSLLQSVEKKSQTKSQIQVPALWAWSLPWAVVSFPSLAHLWPTTT